MAGPVPDPDYVRQTLPRGDTWTLEVEIVGADLTAWDWACQWRAQPDAAEVFADADVDMTQAAEGVVAFTVDAATTSTITPPVSYYWDVERTVGGTKETVVPGRVDVYWDVTR